MPPRRSVRRAAAVAPAAPAAGAQGAAPCATADPPVHPEDRAWLRDLLRRHRG